MKRKTKSITKKNTGIKKKKGFSTIETILVAAALFSLGAYAYKTYNDDFKFVIEPVIMNDSASVGFDKTINEKGR